MTARFRPIHSGFETLRLAAARSSDNYHRFGSATNEQLTARGHGRVTRQSAIFTDFQAR